MLAVSPERILPGLRQASKGEYAVSARIDLKEPAEHWVVNDPSWLTIRRRGALYELSSGLSSGSLSVSTSSVGGPLLET